MTYTNNIYINGCEVKIKNTTIQNGANVIIDAENGVTIESNFEVELGAQFEIKK